MQGASVNLPTSDSRPTGFIKNRYGSRKGFLRFCFHEVLRYLGCYKSLTQVDFQQVKRLVFVCQGNICRSPLGEVVAKSNGISATSFGLNTRGGDGADPRAIAWAKSQEIDLSHHVTKRVDDYVPIPGDLLIGMEPAHIKQLRAHFSVAPVQITLAGLWLEKPFAYLHDPYNTNAVYFERCEQYVYDVVHALVGSLQMNRQSRD